MGIVLGVDLIDWARHVSRLLLLFAGCLVVRAQSPRDLAGLLVDDGDEVGIARIEQQIVRIKAFVPSRKPVIGADHLEIVDMQVVGNLGIANQLKFLFAETEFVDMLGRDPFPDHLPGRVDFINHIIQHLRLLKAFYRMHKVSQHHGVTVRQARPIMVLLGGSVGRLFAERPNGFTVPIQFDERLGNSPIDLPRHQVGTFAFDGVERHEHMAEFAAIHGRIDQCAVTGGIFPFMNRIAIQVDQVSNVVARSKQHERIECPDRVVTCRAGGIDTWACGCGDA